MEDSSCPWQIGSIDTGPKKLLGSPNPPHRASEHPFELRQVLRRTIGERTIGLSPHMFRGVEFRCVGGEVFRMKSWVSKEELPDFFTPVDGSRIPQEDHRTLTLPEQVFEERSDIQASEVPCAEHDIQGHTPSLWGHRQSTDGRNSVLLVEMVEERRPAFRRPGARDVGNEQKAALIEKHQMGPTPCGVFLYAASGNVSNARSALRPVAGRGVVSL